MDILFENRYTVTRERFLDWIKNPIKKRRIMILWTILTFFTGYMFLILILNQQLLFASIYLGLTAFCVYTGFFRFKLLAIKHYKLLSTNQGTVEWERIIQFSDCITVVDGNTTTQYMWNQIDKALDSKNYLVLVVNSGVGIRLDKKS